MQQRLRGGDFNNINADGDDMDKKYGLTPIDEISSNEL
jgi:hypothetical protein